MNGRALLLAVALGGFLAMPAYAADKPDTPEDVSSATGPVAGEPLPADHVEGHIAFLKAELKITPAQEGNWEKVAEAMRKDVAESHTVGQQYARKTQLTALDSLTERAEFAELRAQGERRFTEAFKPLYAMFTAAQKQAADELFANDEK